MIDKDRTQTIGQFNKVKRTFSDFLYNIDKAMWQSLSDLISKSEKLEDQPVKQNHSETGGGN